MYSTFDPVFITAIVVASDDAERRRFSLAVTMCVAVNIFFIVGGPETGFAAIEWFVSKTEPPLENSYDFSREAVKVRKFVF